MEKILTLVFMVAISLAVVACEDGDKGETGVMGLTGPSGPPGPPGEVPVDLGPSLGSIIAGLDMETLKGYFDISDDDVSVLRLANLSNIFGSSTEGFLTNDNISSRCELLWVRGDYNYPLSVEATCT